METPSGPGHSSVPEDVFNVTAAQRPLSQEQTGRTRKYLISMLIRTLCVIGAIFIPGWPRWVLIAGAIVLPYLAVVVANAGRDNDEEGAMGVVPVPQTSLPSSSTNVIIGEIIDPAPDEH